MPKDELHDGLPPLLSLDNLANGAGQELFNEALTRLAANIGDPNTEPTQVRKIVLTLTAKPYKDRTGAELTVKVDNRLAGLKPVESSMYVGNHRGQFLAFTKDSRQVEIDYQVPDSQTAPDGKSRTN